MTFRFYVWSNSDPESSSSSFFNTVDVVAEDETSAWDQFLLIYREKFYGLDYTLLSPRFDGTSID